MGNKTSSTNKQAKADFENLGRDINSKLVQPSAKLFKSDEFKNGVGQGIWNVGSVLGQLSNWASKVLDNPLVTGVVSLLAPELLPGLLTAQAGSKIGSKVGNRLEVAGNKFNGRDNSVTFH